MSKFIKFKRLPDGGAKAIFSKEKRLIDSYYANLWTEELEDTIFYLQSMKRALNKAGVQTSFPKNPS